MIKELSKQLKELCMLTALSSREDEAVKYMYEEFKKSTDNVTVDMLGNVTAAFLSGKENAQKVMMFAHMDEVGLMVKKIEMTGFLRLERLTAVNSHIIPGTVFNVRTHTGKLIPGVVGAKSHHFMSAAEKDKMPELNTLYLDIGCVNKQQVLELGITEGCVLAFQGNYIEMSNDIVATKSLDDRVGLLVLIWLAKHLCGKKFDYDIYLVASVQEEFNIRGIMPAVQAIDPDIAIGLDITPTGDTPDAGGATDIALGGGPAFTYLNYHGRGTLNGIVPNEALVHFLENVCEQGNIPYQREVARGLLTETAYIAISGNRGVATVNVSIPTRYAHTPIETASLKDMEATIHMLEQFVDKWDVNYKLKKI